MQNYIIVHYGELRLKGRNRSRFEDKLINNIRRICGGSVQKLSSSLLCINSKLENFKFVSGISWYATCLKLNKNFDDLVSYFKNIDNKIFKNHKTFALKVKRSDKNYEYNSSQIANTIGDLIRCKCGLSVDLKKPDITIYIEISEYIFVFYKKNKGIGGFPAGIHGKFLCLLSGGIDSPVAAYYMMRKGCHVDLIHFHAFTDNKKVIDSKIDKIVNVLKKYQLSTRLYVVPSYLLDLNVFNNRDIKGYEMILFRKFIYMISQLVAMKNNYKAIVSGDSLGQVASQTIENLNIVLDGINIPVLQPLIAFDKQEIIDISKSIGTYQASIESYKDCCSIVSKNPVTNAKRAKIEQLAVKIDMQNIIKKSVSLIECCHY